MPNIYINNVFIYPEVIKLINIEPLSAAYDFAQQNGADEHITFDVPDEDPKLVAQLYIMNRAKIDSQSSNIMMYLLACYPEYVTLSNKIPGFIFTRKQLCIYMKHGTPDSFVAHYDTIVASIKMSDGIEHIIKCVDNKKAEICCSLEFMPFIPYIHKIFHPETDSYIDIPKYTIENDSIKFVENIFGWREGMHEIKSNGDFAVALKCRNVRDLYINCNLDCCILDHVTIDKVPPEVFATWAIGPKCRKLCNLFVGYLHEPHIYSWCVTWLINIENLFKCSGVRDLSILHFEKCQNADYAFYASKIEKPPSFASLRRCRSMFDSCMHLEEISNIETKNIEYMRGIFARCISLRTAFNNCTFDQLYNMGDAFMYDVSLISAFNNCKFGSIAIDLDDTFIYCMNLTDLFNNCGTIKTKFHQFEHVPSLKNIIGTAFCDRLGDKVCLKCKLRLEDAQCRHKKDLNDE